MTEMESGNIIISPTGLGIRNDSQGAGYYHAPRGNRFHNGIDFICEPGQFVVAPIMGAVANRRVFPYANDEYEGIEIIGPHLSIKMFYCLPKAGLFGRHVEQGVPVAVAQDISQKYSPEMTPHIHLEITSINPDLVRAFGHVFWQRTRFAAPGDTPW